MSNENTFPVEFAEGIGFIHVMEDAGRTPQERLNAVVLTMIYAIGDLADETGQSEEAVWARVRARMDANMAEG